MASAVSIPPTNVPILGDDGQFTLPWRRALQQIASGATVSSSDLSAIQGALTAAAASATSAQQIATQAMAAAQAADTSGLSPLTLIALGALDSAVQLSAGTGITLMPNPIQSSGVIALTVPVTVPHGGTGDTTLTAHGVLIGEGNQAVNVTAAMGSGQLLIGQGATSDPSPQTISAAASINAGGAVSLRMETAILFSALPVSPTKGQRAFISDCTTNTFNALAAGSGADSVPLFYDGSAWRVG
jgi:hypothetical protein